MNHRRIRRYVLLFVLWLSLLVVSACEQSINEQNDASEEISEVVSTTIEILTEVEMNPEFKTPLSQHGQLRVVGTQIVDQTGKPFQLRGVSTHGIQWFPEYVSRETFKTMRDDWNINVVRLAMYTDPNTGYHEELHKRVEEGVAYATELDLYVIIDWHILSDGNPNQYKENAVSFFDEMSEQFKDYSNVIYEICNEPNGDVTWARDIKPYAEDLIDVIRKNDKDALIIVGTPTWSQEVDIAANDPIENQENILYALHFYASTHKEGLRSKLTNAINQELPIFVSEFGISDASGNGGLDYEQGEIWLDLLDDYGIGYVAWNLSNKNEASALIRSDVTQTSDWVDADLSPWGLWYIQWLR